MILIKKINLHFIQIIFFLFTALACNNFALASIGTMNPKSCADIFIKINSANISEYYSLKNELTASIDLKSADNKNLAGTYYSLIPKVKIFTQYDNSKDLSQKLREVFEIPIDKSIGLGSGVRNILKHVFKELSSDGYQVLLPDDVYPVYQILAQEAGLSIRTFNTVPHLKIFDNDVVTKKQALVITSPLSPLGRPLTQLEVAKLLSWLEEDSHRRLILDTVYTFDNHFDPSTLSLSEHPNVLIIHSFAKSYLIPGHLGFALGSESTYGKILKGLNSINMTLASRALAILQADPNLPKKLTSEFNKLWIDLTPLIREKTPDWLPPKNGYYSVLNYSSSEIISSLGLLTFPLSIFGSTNSEISVISALPIRREKLFYATVLSNFARGFNKYEMTYSKEGIPESTFPNQFFLLSESEIEIGLNKAITLLQKTNPLDRILIIGTSEDVSNLLPNEKTGKGRYVRSNRIPIEQLFYTDEDGRKKNVRLEDVYADSLKLNESTFVPIHKIKPRSISILPVAKACQACCKFCFSDSSISTEKRRKGLSNDMIYNSMVKARISGAERAVITGGGEPTLIGFPRLNEIIQISNFHFPGRVTLITNGFTLAKLEPAQILEHLIQLDQSGLSTLAISRHHHDSQKNTYIMGIDTQTENILNVYLKNKNSFKNLQIRLICVLQKTGISSEQDIFEYISWANQYGVSEINFKELYVSTDRESLFAGSSFNTYSEQNRVYLSTVLNFAQKYDWKKTAELPWGAPIFEKNINGAHLKIAAYTEPSLFWERTHGIARSWNLMSDGKLLMSLEDGDTEINY